MSVEEHIRHITQKAKELFLEETEFLFRDRVKQENSLARQYKNREIFELLQNIDDAFDPSADKPCVAAFSLQGRCLTVSNNGKPFTIETLTRLCQGKVSSKVGDYIGCKGIGFRSVLNWSDDIAICSGHGEECISVRFSRHYADACYEEIKDNPHVVKQVAELQRLGLEVIYPIFKAPEYQKPVAKSYDTVITFNIKDDAVAEQIKQAMADFDSSVILFLPHISEISFTVEDREFHITKERTSHDVVSIHDSRSQGKAKAYWLGERNDVLDRKYEGSDVVKMAVAIPVEEEDTSEYKLFSFFPVNKLESPFHALLHATFCLIDNRNDLDTNSDDTTEANKQALSHLLRFYADFVVQKAKGLRRLRLLMPANFRGQTGTFRFDGSLGGLSCHGDYFQYCSQLPILPATNGSYIVPGDSLPIILESFPHCFYAHDIPNLIEAVADDNLRAFARGLVTYGKFKPYDIDALLKEAINRLSAEWPAQTRIEVFKWWCDSGFSGLPLLIKRRKDSQEESFITSCNEQCFLSASIETLPPWTSISIIAHADEECLLHAYEAKIKEEQLNSKDSAKRILPRLIRKDIINLQEQSSRQVMISPVNNSVNRDFQRSLDFVHWLWGLWSVSKFDSSILSNISFNLPGADGRVHEAQQLYLGANYGNSLGAALFRNMSSFHALAFIELEDAPAPNMVKAFFKALGVNIMPVAKRCYRELVRNVHPDECFWSYLQWLGKKNGLPESDRWNYSLFSVTNLSDILDKVPFYDIVRWLLLPANNVVQRIASECEPAESLIGYRQYRKQSYSAYNSNWQLPSFLRYVFGHKPWIEIDNHKYAACDLLISKDPFLLKLNEKVLTERKIDDMAAAIGCEPLDLRELFVSLGVKSSFLALSSERFYGLLLKISQLTDPAEIQESKRLSREIYRTVIENGRSQRKLTDFYAASDAKARFFAEGKVLARNRRDAGSYQPVAKVFFSSSAVANLDDSYLIDIPARSGKIEDFKDIFNISPFELNYRVIDFAPSLCHNAFESDYKSFLPYLMTYRSDKVDKVCNLTVGLVQTATLEVNGREKAFEDMYGLLKVSKSHWLVFVGQETDYSRLAKERLAADLEQVFNVFYDFPSREFLGKVVQLFMATPQQRDFFVKRDFGSLDELRMTRREMADSTSIKSQLKERLHTDFPDCDCDTLIDSTDWLDLASPLTQEHIVRLLKTIGQGTDYIASIINRHVSLAAYNRKVLEAEFLVQENHYRQLAYNHLYPRPERWSELASIWSACSMEQCRAEDMEALDFDAASIVGELMRDSLSRHRITMAKAQTTTAPGFDTFYPDNLALLQSLDEDADFINNFTNNPEYQSLLYFDNQELVKEKFEKMRDELLSKEASASSQAKDSIQQLIDNCIIDSQVTPGHIHIATHAAGSTTVSGHSAISRSKNQKRQGNLAEYMVVCKLIDRLIPEVVHYLGSDYTVSWRSGAALRVNLPEGYKDKCDITHTDEKLGYDIELHSTSGRTMFIEVKSSSGDECAFIMSAGEFRRAASLPADTIYRVVFVAGLQIHNPQAVPRISLLDADLSTDAAFDRMPSEYHIAFHPCNPHSAQA